MIKLKQLACVALAVSLTGCGTLFQQNKAQPGEPSEGSHSELLQCPRSVPPNGFRSFIDAKPQALSLAKVPDPRCTSAIPNASYTGPYKGADDLLLSADLERDLYCASWFKAAKYPNGFIGIYGSSRITEANQQADARVKQANDKVYQEVKAFAEQWTRQYGKQLPVLTGAGGGLMEAAARGAMAAGGPSIGYTTYYGKAREGGGKPDLAFWTYGTQADGSKAPLITDGLILSSVGIREYARAPSGRSSKSWSRSKASNSAPCRFTCWAPKMIGSRCSTAWQTWPNEARSSRAKLNSILCWLAPLPN